MEKQVINIVIETLKQFVRAKILKGKRYTDCISHLQQNQLSSNNERKIS